MLEQQQCFVFEGERPIEAELRRSEDGDALRWARQWAPEWPAAVAFEDAHWDWEALIDLSLVMPEQFACYCVLVGGELQGLHLLEVSEDEVALYGTHALRVSTAPWNRRPQRRYRGVGSLLIAAGLMRSIGDDHEGQLHCSSLPKAELFHANNGMERFNGLDDEGLARFRFHPEGARDFLARLRAGGYLVHQWT